MKGSYQLDSFTGNRTAEVERLHAQVNLFFEKEFDTYVRFGLENGMRIIEAGSGPGFLIKNILERLPDCDATALEIDPFLVNILQQNSVDKGKKLFEVRHASIYDTRLPDNYFDFAITRLVIEHLQEPLKGLQEIYRILKPGGKLVIVSNDFDYHLLTFPSIPELDVMYKAYCKSRFSEGGNPLIGRLIPKYLRREKFTNIRFEIINVHSELEGDRALLQAENVNISKSLVNEGFMTKDTLDSLATKWYEMLQDPDHVIFRQLFVSCGEKNSSGEKGIEVSHDVNKQVSINTKDDSELKSDHSDVSEFLRNQVKRIMGDENLEISDDDKLNKIDIDSIGAAELNSIIKKRFNKSVSISDILQKLSIGEITGIILRSQGPDNNSEKVNFSATTGHNGEEVIEISPIQEQFWILNKMYQDDSAYNIPSLLKLEGRIDIRAFEYALREIIRRHEILRSVYLEMDNKVYQKVLNDPGYQLCIEKLDIPFAIEKINEKISDEVQRKFNLSEWPQFRIKLFSFNDDISVLSLVFHHILIDLQSRNIFSTEFSELYNAYIKGEKLYQISPSGKYSDYTRWLKSWLSSQEALNKIEEWKREISAGNSGLHLPVDFPRPVVETLEGKRQYFRFDYQTSQKILRLADQYSVNAFTILLSAYSILLHRLSNEERFNIGVPLTNRRNAEFSGTFGCFVNIVPVSLEFSGQQTCSDIIHQVRQALLRVHRKQEIPFLKINESAAQGRKSLFRAGFTMEAPISLTLSDVQAHNLEINKKGSQLDLFMTLWQGDENILGYLEYSTMLFSDLTISRFIDMYNIILMSILENPDLIGSELSIVPKNEFGKIMEWNNTDTEYSTDICLHHKLEQQVLKTPDAPAIMFGKSIMTYLEFDKNINRLANHLVSSGVRTEDIICIGMGRSPELLIGIYSILKAGAAYLPVDPAYPSERIEMILADAKPKFILTDRNSDKNFPEEYSKIYLDNILISPLSDNDEAPGVNVRPENMAYLMYTSGSTGKPKGVMIEHHSVINKLEWMQKRHPLKADDTILLKTPVTFDVSVWELFWWTFNGARLAILPAGGEKEPKIITEEIESKQVTTIVFVPSMFSPFIGYVKANSSVNRLKSLKWIIQIGEPLTPNLVNSFNELRSDVFNPVLVNTYGPTEATVAVSWYDCPGKPNVEKVFIGKPIQNTKLLIVNGSNRIQPVGVPGELVISGVNLSRGYLNRPELNAEKFFFLEYPDGRKLRCYKTGDLARWTEDGNIDFIGRIDSQVKVRGYRIELGDIESALLSFPGIKSSAVIVNDSDPDNKFLTGYIVFKEDYSTSTEEIKSFLLKKLPGYMIPAHLIIIDKMPLNNSGKIDKKALPAVNIVSSSGYVDPDSQYEKKLLPIFRETLRSQEIGVTHNFFDAGGNSLLSIRIVNEIREKLNLSVEPLHIMQYPDIRKLAKFISSLAEGQADEKITVSGINERRQDFSRLRERRR
jgi:amino acid adenylation domain-containing protein